MRYFTYSEFDQKDGKIPNSGERFMDKQFLANLDTLRSKCGFVFNITSGYRSPKYNDKVSSTGLTGPHTTGKAADIAVSRDHAYILLKNAFEMGCFTGIGIKQKGNKRFIHLDTIEGQLRPTIWSY